MFFTEYCTIDDRNRRKKGSRPPKYFLLKNKKMDILSFKIFVIVNVHPQFNFCDSSTDPWLSVGYYTPETQGSGFSGLGYPVEFFHKIPGDRVED